jgi:hypothetical protein
MKNTYAIICFLLFSIVNQSIAKIWQVGPSRVYKLPSEVAGLVGNTDTIEIDAGLYTADVATWFASHLLIRGVGGGFAHLDAAGQHAEGKAIWVIKGANCRIENIEFSGCKVPDMNGAGIRQEGAHLTLTHCYFHHNENGVLTNNDGVSIDVFEGCEFAFNGYGDGYSHNIYVGHIQSFTLRNSYTHDAIVGHLVKSRAENNFLYYNRLSGENGDGSYEIDLPNGGFAKIVGNIIEQSPNSQNGGMITFGLEGATNQNQEIGLVNNTIWNRRANGRFLHCSNQTQAVKMVNNIVIGSGALFTGSTINMDSTNNLILADTTNARFVHASAYDFRLLPNAPAIDAGIFVGLDFSATQYYLHPLQVRVRVLNGLQPDIGAYEYAPVSGTTNVFDFVKQVSVYPNPLSQSFTLELGWKQIGICSVQVVNQLGQIVQTMRINHENGLIAASLPPGLYRLLVFENEVLVAQTMISVAD